MNICLIPARSGSKRIKNKNIKIFLNKPIIKYTLEAAKKSKLFDIIHVSTDSNKIKKIVEKDKIKIAFMRPKKLSGDNVPLIDVFKYVVSKYQKMGFNFKEVWSLMPCSPLITYKDLKKISKFINKIKFIRPILSVSKYQVPIQWAYKIRKNNILKPISKRYLTYKSQELSTTFFDSGQFIIYPVTYFEKKNRKKIDKDFMGYILPQHKSIDIDDIDDWKLAEITYRGINKSLK